MFSVIMALIFLCISVTFFVLSRSRKKESGTTETVDRYEMKSNKHSRQVPRWAFITGGWASLVIAFICVASTSIVYIDSDETGHLKKIYGSSELADGRIIATSGEKGYQADILRPGFHFSLLLTVINDIEKMPIVTIPAGFYGRIETRDGIALPKGQIMAAEWHDDEFAKMLDATYFLGEGSGQKGLQTSVLKPGRYPLNLYLFKVVYGNGNQSITYDMDGESRSEGSTINTLQTTIPAGHVGVVTSRIQSRPDNECVVEEKTVVDEKGREVTGALSVPLVPNGCRGIWNEALKPGGYFLNRDAYLITEMNTRVMTWRYDGGYTRRELNLSVDDAGEIKQKEVTSEIQIPENAADSAVSIKVEGWTVHQNLRALVQVTPANAPIVVAAVGGLKEVEDRVLTPAIIAEVRDVLGGQAVLPTMVNGEMVSRLRPVKILDLVENRDPLQTAVDLKVREHGRKAGVNIMEVRFGNPDIPPEMLVARKREQLATQLSRAYVTERQAQVDRQKTEREKALADKQSQLVQAEVNVKKAEQTLLERAKLGEAEKAYLESLAQGEKARALVLGEDRVMMLNVVDKILATLQEKPELMGFVDKLVPNTVVTGSGGGLEGPMAVLGQALGRDSATKE